MICIMDSEHSHVYRTYFKYTLELSFTSLKLFIVQHITGRVGVCISIYLYILAKQHVTIAPEPDDAQNHVTGTGREIPSTSFAFK